LVFGWAKLLAGGMRDAVEAAGADADGTALVTAEPLTAVTAAQVRAAMPVVMVRMTPPGLGTPRACAVRAEDGLNVR
jgi:hypothetical protein